MIIKRYLWKELLVTFAAVFLVLIMIFAGQSFVRFMAAAASGELPGELVLKLLGLQLAIAMGQLLPFAWFISVLLAFGRLYKDNEMTIFSACGLSIVRIVKMMFLPGLFIALFVAAVTLYIKPLAEEYSVALKEEVAKRTDVSSIAAGGFNEIGGSDRVFYVESLSEDHTQMSNVFIYGQQADKLDIFTAPTSAQVNEPKTGERYMVLLDGYRYERDMAGNDFKVYEYKEASIRIEPAEVIPAERKRRALPTMQLINSDDPKDAAELHWRIAMPVSVMVLSILAILMSYTTPREGRFAKVFGAVLIYIIYSNFLGIGQAWLSAGKVDTSLGLWWVHLLAVAVIAILYGRRYGWYWTFTSMSKAKG